MISENLQKGLKIIGAGIVAAFGGAFLARIVNIIQWLGYLSTINYVKFGMEHAVLIISFAFLFISLMGIILNLLKKKPVGEIQRKCRK